MDTFTAVTVLVLVLGTSFVPSVNSVIPPPPCRPSGTLAGVNPPEGQCESQCCFEGAIYTVYQCSPPVQPVKTVARLALESFMPGTAGGAAAACDSQYHSDDTPVVAFPTGWFDRGSRCLGNVTIYGNGRKVVAMVVDECDSTGGCDADHGFRPPCGATSVVASRAVWVALGVPRAQWGSLPVSWSDH